VERDAKKLELGAYIQEAEASNTVDDKVLQVS